MWVDFFSLVAVKFGIPVHGNVAPGVTGEINYFITVHYIIWNEIPEVLNHYNVAIEQGQKMIFKGRI